MAKRIRAKLVLELLGQGLSAREIQASRHIAPRSVNKVRKAAERKGIGWTDVRDMEERAVYELLFPDVTEDGAAFLDVDWDYVHDELKRPGVTLKLLHEELGYEAAGKGLALKGYNTFCRGYKDYVVSRRVTNHLEHKPAQVMEVDWNGTTMQLTDELTGRTAKAYLFVACLPYSQMSYVEATPDMRQNTWLACHVHAFEFFGGVAVRCVCDNLKTGVISHPKHGEVTLNAAYEALGEHYLCAIMPTGVRKPKQKASVEGTCGKVATAIVARLRNETFHTMEELNAAVRARLDDFNSAPFQKRELSRREVFERDEAPLLTPLPGLPFEVAEWVYGRKVALNFHVTFQKNHYSVPYEHVGKKADLKVTARTVEVYVAGERVATHPRFDAHDQWRYQTDPSHMPPAFAVTEWDDERIRRWAASIGPNTAAVVERVFSDAKVKEQAYNPALAVLNLSKPYEARDLEDACAYALERAMHPRCKFIRSVLATKAHRRDGAAGGATGSSAGYLRGADYYRGDDGSC